MDIHQERQHHEKRGLGKDLFINIPFLGWFHPNQEGPKDVSDKWDDSIPPKVDAALAEKESVYFFKVQVLQRLKDINNVLKQFNMFQIISKIQGVKEFFKWRSDPPPRLSNLVSIP